MINKKLKKIMLAAGIASSFTALPVHAANWLMLQGTEPDASAERAKVWGFIQPTYQTVDGTKLPVGPWAGQDSQFNTHQPDLSSNSNFQLQRARIAVRGTGFPLDSNVNYFVMAEFGNNGITSTAGGNGSAKLTDATVTLNHIKGARIRVGQMKIPMSEEVYQGIITFNYINFTNVANQQLIERPFWTDGAAACDPVNGEDNYLKFCNGDAETQFRSNSVAVRDTGIQVFDTFKVNDWEHSYAVLLGKGGINGDDRDNDLDTTVYWSSEKLYGGGDGPWREGWKFYAWNTSGKRTIYDSATLNAGGTSLTAAERTYDRKLTGIGTTYLKDKYRIWAEYIKAEGMIFNGSTGGAVPGAVNNTGTAVSQFQTSVDGESDGWYIDFGYKITPKIELDYRYDVYNRVTNLAAAAERKYDTSTFGMQYFFNKKTRLIVNYEVRSLEAPGQASTAAANQIGDSMDDRISAQIFAAF
ncbi:MAG TPA: porin [Gammaproteobacteria bacterium]